MIEYEDLIQKYEGDNFIYQDKKALRDIINPCGGEYLAFDFGFHICLLYEINRVDGNDDELNI